MGPVRKAYLHFDRSGRSTGIAEVTFENPADAERALKKYNNVELDGKQSIRYNILSTGINCCSRNICFMAQ